MGGAPQELIYERMKTAMISEVADAQQRTNRTIRKHPDFVTATERLGLVEVATEGSRHPNALQRLFGPSPGATYHWDVQGSQP